ncbi:hypothetical protein V4V36_28600 [Paenibacillus lautus]|uniref:hypothetical protein n=1 Tax=Paenibacillus lautus TaxID=1401 RepID=UPI002FBE08E8|nr:hypothetical protein [Cytobacillus firmus]
MKNISHELKSQITSKQAIGSLIAALDKVGFSDSMDAAAVVIEFESSPNQLPKNKAETLYTNRW